MSKRSKKKPKQKPSNKGYIPLCIKSAVIYFCIVVSILSFGIYTATNSKTTEALIDVSQSRQSIQAISGAKGIESYLEQLGRSLATLARNEDIILMNQDSHTSLKHFSNDWSSEAVTGVMLINDKGIGVYNYVNKEEKDNLSVDVSDRDYYIWAKTAKTGEYFFGKPIVPREGLNKENLTIPLATPLIKNGEFAGVLTTGITISQLNSKFIDPIRFPSNSMIYIIDENGIFLTGQDDEYLGKTFQEYIEEEPFLGDKIIAEDIEEIMLECEAGGINVALPNGNGVNMERFIVSYSPIMCDTEHHWTIFITTPVKDSLQVIAPIYINEIGILITSFLLVILVTIAFHKFSKK